MHQQFEALFRNSIDSSALSSGEQQDLLPSTAELQQTYTENTRLEESIVFPHARPSVDEKAIAAIELDFQVQTWKRHVLIPERFRSCN